MATSHSEERILRTSDLTLASFLIVEGFTSELSEDGEEVKTDHPKGSWEFVETPTLFRTVQEFNNGEATVEPRAFHKAVNQTRKDMFEFLGIGQRRSGGRNA